ncbi:MAG TPA: GGDEF domain-containing protein [Candidatus Elarobacter sp.]
MILRAGLFLVLAAAAFQPVPGRAAEPQPPASWSGAPIAGDAPAASLLRPATVHAAFRAPRVGTALYVGTPWFVRDLSVTVVGPGARRETLIGTSDLPGRMLGVRLPSDAWQADRVEVEASTVSTAAPLYLLPAEELARIAWRTWWYAALFGLFGALAIAGGTLAATLRSRLSAIFAALMAAQGALLVPWLGIVRPVPEVSQPLHALLQCDVFAALAAFALAFARAVPPPSWLARAVYALLAFNVIAVIGGDVLQDLWIIPDIAAQALAAALHLSLVAVAVLALRARISGARWFAAATITAALCALAGVVPLLPDAFVRSLPLTGSAVAALLLTLALTAHLGKRESGRPAAAPRGANLDGLTEIANRTTADDHVERAWHAAAIARTPLATLLVDVDHLRKYNEIYGHLAGDDALRRIAGVLAGCASRRDDLAARYDGDTLLVVLCDTDLAGARSVAESILAAVARLEIAHGGAPSKRLSVTVGAAALVPDAGTETGELLRRAATALYIAKTMGRNRVVTDEPITVPAPLS